MTAIQFVDDTEIWDRAVELAERGRGHASPNPCVGAVLVRDGRLIGEGWHRRRGGLHAEREALADARVRGEDPAGAAMYVTLEPCAHHGSQPPCSEALIEAGIAEVVIGSDDPTEKTAGIGPRQLEQAGITVRRADDEAADRCRGLVQDFRKMAATGRPLVLLKLAMTLDGRVATRTGDSRWITGPEARTVVHRLRAHCDAVAVGSGTFSGDDPRLTVRPEEHPDAAADSELRQPTRVLFDSGPVVTPDAALFDDIETAPLVIVTKPSADPERSAELEGAGATVIRTGVGTPAERFREALDRLGEKRIASVLLEGGPTLAGAALAAGEVDRAEIFVAPLLLGGGMPAIAGEGPDLISEATRAEDLRISRVGQDVHMSARINLW
ncbi:MAG: bifunctional diaminohydroxyphosphoribosylaminopyrimidine deaminase/5-amino-6-(5-phosphoribosylamino)uracil reductase RibD [Solirubrobacterales bacterium]|nr:bifunctional diaminohydroxyphosphoribosylaminopyrimidine deaminase/5-amino-6-(5-phosphoribosylamino)uracil reductase RibD [Solirubrobacterales bacterium]